MERFGDLIFNIALFEKFHSRSEYTNKIYYNTYDNTNNIIPQQGKIFSDWSF
jgi:hypothetical protein